MSQAHADTQLELVMTHLLSCAALGIKKERVVLPLDKFLLVLDEARHLPGFGTVGIGQDVRKLVVQGPCGPVVLEYE